MSNKSTEFIFREMFKYLTREQKKAETLLTVTLNRRAEGKVANVQAVRERLDLILARKVDWHRRASLESLEALAFFFAREDGKRVERLLPYEEYEAAPDHPRSRREEERVILANISSFLLLLQREIRALQS